ncbi:MAG: hypothetical protein JXQ65_11275 [Candidatus Marinimicrobia bacterium]|nr:hypothetical protein [Candidatus Neomarinimicrobiota bacterium]
MFTNLKKIKQIVLLLLLMVVLTFAADQYKTSSLSKSAKAAAGPIVDNNYKWHKVGRMWTRITNYGMLGDDAYTDRTPSGDYPGGSGNSYLYRGSLWLSGFVDGTFHVTKVEDSEYSPIDSVHQIFGDETLADSEIWTKYYDVSTPLAAGHFPLGLEITERSYAWSASYAADFVIYEYTIKNIGIDSDGDGYPDQDQTIDNFYFTMRLDGDVSKLTTWDAEYAFSNQDDITMANGVPWTDWLSYFPEMTGYDDLFAEAPVDSSMVFMFDGDNPDVVADNGQDNDFGNPSADGTLQTPGFLVFRILKTEPQMPKHSFHQCNIYNDPTSDKETWDRMIGKPVYEPLLLINGAPFPYDYRGILTYGPLDQLAPGDSVKVTCALGVGCDEERGGVYSILDMIKDMDVAKFLVDNNYEISAEALSPGAPVVDISPSVVDGVTKGIRIQWDKETSLHPKFKTYKVSKGQKTGTGAIAWETLATYTIDEDNWPPSENENGKFEMIDEDIINGLVYYYSVQTQTEDVQYPIPFGVIESSITDQLSFNVISPSNPEATDNLDRVKVVPNPYIGSARWNNSTPSSNSPWEHRLQFTNLPGDAEVKIFTLDGDYIASVYANETVILGEDFNVATASVAEWDLMTRNNQEAAPGIYLFVIDSKSLGSTTGKFVIVR